MPSTSKQVQEYRRTIPGLLTLIYANQKMTSKKYGRPLPEYTKEQLKEWMLSQPHFQTLLDNWISSNYLKNLSPSIDRKDNTKGYILSNIQLVTFRENLENQKKQNKSGEYLHTGSKTIRQLDLCGNELAIYGSISNAIRANNLPTKSVSNLSAVANGLHESAYGYIWQWV